MPEQITPSGAEFKLSVNKPATITLDDGLTTSDSLAVTEPDGAVLTLTAQSARLLYNNSDGRCRKQSELLSCR